MKRHKIQVKESVRDLYIKEHNIILLESHLVSPISAEEGDILELRCGRYYIATAYYGKQNKGLGWVLSTNEQEAINEIFFEKQIHAGFYERLAYLKDDTTSAFRVFNGEGDGIGGLTIDYYDGYFLVTTYSAGIGLYIDWIFDSIEGLKHLEIQGFNDVKGIYLKRRYDHGGKYIDEKSFKQGKEAPEPLIVLENGVKYASYLDDGAMTGIFLDQKQVRAIIKDKYAKGRSVLNIFSYTGAFSVAALAGGAVHTTSVDLAKRSVEKTKEQFMINDMDVEGQDIIVMDVFNYFKWAVKKEKQFEMVILDPPAFARSKQMTFSVAKDYTWLVENAIDITAENGIIIASTNSANLPINKFKKQIDTAFKNKGFKYEVLEKFTCPEDFRTNDGYYKSDYLKVFFIKKL